MKTDPNQDKKTKTTTEDFELFQRAFWHATRALGGTDYEVHFSHETVEGSFATIAHTDAMVARVTLSEDWEGREVTPEELFRSAAHEACHLWLAEMSSLVHRRFVGEDEAYRAEEGYIHRLEKLMGWRNPSGSQILLSHIWATRLLEVAHLSNCGCPRCAEEPER